MFNSILSFRLIEERYSSCSLVKLEIDLGIGPFNLFPPKYRTFNCDEEIFWNWRGPVSWFWCRYSRDKEGIVYKTKGIAPMSEFWDKSREDKLVSLLISDGIDPFNWFLDISILMSLVIFVSEIGNLPSKLLYERCNSSSCVRFPSEDGTFPEKRL